MDFVRIRVCIVLLIIILEWEASSMDEIRNEEVVVETTEAKATTQVDEAAITANEQVKTKVKESPLTTIKNAFSPQKRKKTIALLVAAVIVIVAIICVLSYLSPKNVAVRYAEAFFEEDVVTENKIAAYDLYAFLVEDDYETEEDLFEWYSDYYKEDITSWKDLAKCNKQIHEDWMYEEFGKYKVSSETSRIKDLSIRHLEEENDYFLSFLEEHCGFDRDDISKAKQAIVKMKIKGDYDSDRVTFDVTLVKIGGVWKGFDCGYEFDSVSDDYDWDDWDD